MHIAARAYVIHLDFFLGRLSGLPAATLEERMKTRSFRAIVAAVLVLFLTLLFDYCRYQIEHHPHFDFTRTIYLSIQGAVFGINFVAVLKFVESFNPRA